MRSTCSAVDSVPRMKPVPLVGKHGFLMSASTGQVGGIRAHTVLLTAHATVDVVGDSEPGMYAAED